MAFIMITVFGVVFTGQLQMSLLPDVEAPAAVVICYYNGANPSDMEQLVTRPLESSISTLAGVDAIESSSSENFSREGKNSSSASSRTITPGSTRPSLFRTG